MARSRAAPQEGLGRVKFEGARRHGLHLVPGLFTPEIDGGLAERTEVEVHDVTNVPDTDPSPSLSPLVNAA